MRRDHLAAVRVKGAPTMTYQPPQNPYQGYQPGPPQPAPGSPPPGPWPQLAAPGQPAPAYYGGQPRPRRKRRVFVWVFLAVQVLFLILLIAGLAGTSTAPSHAQIVSACYNHAWWPVYNSQAQCVAHTTKSLTDSGDLGEGLGVLVEIIFWVVIDAILGISYAVYRLATRTR
jgi:hypothetical protein